MSSPALPFTFGPPVHTDRLIVRAMTDRDVEDIYAYQSLAEVCAYLPFTPRTRAEVRTNVARWASSLTLVQAGDAWRLAVERRTDPGRVIGDVFFAISDVAHAAAEIGWTLHPAHSGSGYMTEAAGAVLDIAFGELRLHRVMAQLDPRNHASAALCARLGMRQEAHFREDQWFRGAWADTAVWAILDREWAAARHPSPPVQPG
jgi:RimJ/RimL family protein N-acetyltransferase